MGRLSGGMSEVKAGGFAEMEEDILGADDVEA
jgi:hypothetical protein